MMALYKEHKINPFGGCLPQLLQLPVWWALYTSLSTNVELFKRPFFGFWQDLDGDGDAASYAKAELRFGNAEPWEGTLSAAYEDSTFGSTTVLSGGVIFYW